MLVMLRTGVPAMIISVLFAIMITGEARADSVADFYKGERITLTVGYSAGGGFDTRARLVARFMGRYIPGNPDIVVQNMPGAGSKRLANHLYNVAPRDGTVIGSFNQTMATDNLFKVPGTEFDGRKFLWLGSLLKSPAICFAWKGSGIETMADLKSKKFIVGATGTGAPTYILPVTMNHFLGTQIEVIPGYKGSNGVMLAIEQREVQGICGTNWDSLVATKPDWISEGKVTIIGQMGLAKDPALPDVPLMLDLVEDENDKAAWKLLFVNRSMANPFAAPPGLPEDRIQALRRAFDATVRDPEFLAEAEKLRMSIRPNTGEEIDALLEQVYAAPAHVVDMAVEALATK